MGCGASKDQSHVATGEAPPNSNERSGFNVAKEALEDVGDKLSGAVEKVAGLALTGTKKIGEGLKTQAHHLKNVFVPPIAGDDLLNFTLPVFPKLPEERQFIAKALNDNFIFANLEPQELKSIIDAFEKTEFQKGAEILKQGDEEADYFYVIFSGSCSYHVDGKKVGESGAGKSFGELSLLYSCPRAATVKAKEDCVLFRVDQKSFRFVLQKKNVQTAEQKLELLKKISFLKDLEIFDLQKLSSAMTPVNFEPGDYLVVKGEAGDAFFVIQEGSCKVTDISVGNSTFEDVALGPGDYFGERALVTSEPRAANVVAESRGIAMRIDKETFEAVLGNLKRLILKSQDKGRLIGIKIIHDTYLEDASLDSLAGLITDRKFKKGDVIMEEGKETIAALYFVREGKVDVKSSDETKAGACSMGSYFGEDLLSIDVQYAKAEERHSVSVDFSSELTLDKPAKFKAKYTVTVLEDAVCGVLSIRDCRRVFDTTRIGSGDKARTSNILSQSAVEKKMTFDELERHVMLGSGTFGQVWLVSVKGAKDPTAYALKIQSKVELIQAHQAKGVVQEMTIMKELQYPFLLRLVKTFQDTDFVYMLLGLVQGGELFSRIHSSVFDGVPETTAKFYAAGVYEGLAYMHRRSIIYRDLKPENILIDSVGYPVIVDFGFAKKVVDKTYTFCGTPLYIAPEVILNRGHNSAADVWSFGVLVAEMITGDTPFYKDGMGQLDLYREICSAPFKPHPMLHGKDHAIEFISKLLDKTAAKRLGSLKNGQNDIFGHPWFADIAFEQYRARELKAPWVPKIKDPLDSSNFDSWKHMKDKTTEKWPPLDDKKQAIFLGF